MDCYVDRSTTMLYKLICADHSIIL